MGMADLPIHGHGNQITWMLRLKLEHGDHRWIFFRDQGYHDLGASGQLDNVAKSCH